MTKRKPNTPEHNANISKARTGMKHTEESKQKMSESGKVKIFTEEHRTNLSKALAGKQVSDNTKTALETARKKPVEINGVVYDTITEAAQALNMTVRVMGSRLDSDKYPEFKRLPKP